MLPTNNWIPTVLDEDRFTTVDIPLPEPIIGYYRDFAGETPESELNIVAMGLVSSGELNTAEGFVGRDADFRATMESQVILGSVYGCVMIDRMVVPAVRGVSSGARSELPP